MSRLIKDYVLPPQAQKATAIAWSPDGTLLAFCSLNGDIHLWDTEDKFLKKVIHSDCSTQPWLTWSPDSEALAVHTSDADKSIKLWDVETGKQLKAIHELTRWTTSLAWSPDGKFLAAGSSDGTIRLWSVPTGEHLFTLSGHEQKASCLLWSPDSKLLISGSVDKTIIIRETHTWRIQKILIGHFQEVSCLTWLTQDGLIASGSHDCTVRIWDPETGLEKRILEAHTATITSISAFDKGHLLATQAEVVRIWSTKTWEPVAILAEASPEKNSALTLAFQSSTPQLALVHDEETGIHIYDMQDEQNLATISSIHLAHPIEKVVHYTNAKVVLVGEAGVGKSALALVLMGEPFRPTTSSHAHDRKIFSFDNSKKHPLKDGTHLEADTLLWDLAGQPSYRLTHQLHLKDVALALVLFDYHNDTDPFAGVDYWNNVLNQAKKVQDVSRVPMKKILIAARIDVGGRRVNETRIKDFYTERGFDSYYQTSAKDGINIQMLIQGIKDIIDWDALPRRTSPDLFQNIKRFLLSEKKRGLLLATTDDLFRTFQSINQEQSTNSNLRNQFETCINLVESSGLIHRLSFNNYVLLQPELVDVYASALVNSVSNDPDGAGDILESQALEGAFMIPGGMRIANKDQEKMLLFAMIEDLLRNEVVLRDQGYLVFPSQSTKEHPVMPDLKEQKQTVSFTFEGPVANIYAVLAVRLSRSGLFTKTGIWKNTAVYTTPTGGTYGISLHNCGEGQGQLTLFFDEHVSAEMRFNFEKFVERYLERNTLTLQREPIFSCEQCGEVIDSSTVMKKREKGWTFCPECGRKTWLLDDETRLTTRVDEMNRTADEQRHQEVAHMQLEQKIALEEFDIFFSYHENDIDEVKEIAKHLKKEGYLPWLDEWELRPGFPEQSEREKQIKQIECAAIFIGKYEVDPWRTLEEQAVLRQFVARKRPVIPVLLPSASYKPDLPSLLATMRWVDFRERDPDPIGRLIHGITGKKNA